MIKLLYISHHGLKILLKSDLAYPIKIFLLFAATISSYPLLGIPMTIVHRILSLYLEGNCLLLHYGLAAWHF